MDKYQDKFDKGWDKVREETLERQKQMGIVPKNTNLTPPNEGVQKWDDLSAEEKKLFSSMMECYAGLLGHADHEIGRFITFLEEIGNMENTLIYVCSDNGASAEDTLTGLFNEMAMANLIPESVERNLKKIDELGGPTCYNDLSCWLGYGRRHAIQILQAIYSLWRHEGSSDNTLATRDS